MKDYSRYLRDPGKLYTERWPWTIDSARIDGKAGDIFVKMYGEEAIVTSAASAIIETGVVPIICFDAPTAFPEYDDDPRLLMLSHKADILIYSFKNETGGNDPTGPVEIPTEEEAVKYCKANGIPVPDWLT